MQLQGKQQQSNPVRPLFIVPRFGPSLALHFGIVLRHKCLGDLLSPWFSIRLENQSIDPWATTSGKTRMVLHIAQDMEVRQRNAPSRPAADFLRPSACTPFGFVTYPETSGFAKNQRFFAQRPPVLFGFSDLLLKNQVVPRFGPSGKTRMVLRIARDMEVQQRLPSYLLTLY